ncbi:MAG: DUF4153 domain-containing protein [Candidatus Limnocylindria bacterium]
MRRATLTLLLAAAFGLAAQLLFYRESLGLNVAAALILFLGMGWRLRSARPHRLDLWIPSFALAFAAFLAIRTDAALVAFDLLAATGLALASTASLRGSTVTVEPVRRLIDEAWRTVTGTLWRAVPVLRCGIRHIPLSRAPGRQVLPYVGGLALAVPFLVLFAALFTSADPVFAHWWEKLIDLGRWAERLGEAKDRALIALIASWLAAGALVRIDRPHRDADRQAGGLLSVETATAFLVAIVLLFAAFVMFQIAYLFGGRDTMEAVSISYADYARRGFFELLAVAGIVGTILFGLELALRRRTRLYLASGLALIGLTAVVLASSLYRLDLYQRAHGWSELRLYVLAALATVAAALVLIAWGLVARRMTVALQPILFVGLGIALLVNAIGPSGFIVRANVSRLLEPIETPGRPMHDVRERSLDRWYLVRLGEGALPDLVAVRSRLPDLERFCLDVQLFWRYSSYELAAPSWQSWNLDRERARSAVAFLKASVLPALGDPRSRDQMERLRQRALPQCLGLPVPPARVYERPVDPPPRSEDGAFPASQ